MFGVGTAKKGKLSAIGAEAKRTGTARQRAESLERSYARDQSRAHGYAGTQHYNGGAHDRWTTSDK